MSQHNQSTNITKLTEIDTLQLEVFKAPRTKQNLERAHKHHLIKLHVSLRSFSAAKKRV